MTHIIDTTPGPIDDNGNRPKLKPTPKPAPKPKPTDPVRIDRYNPTERRPLGEAPSTKKVTEYTVKSGDTVSKIAARYHMSTAEVIKLNKLKHNGNVINVGQKLYVYLPKSNYVTDRYTPHPTGTTDPDSYKKHVVKYGDTLSAIASKYKVTVADLVKWNNIKNPNIIYPNQIFRVEPLKPAKPKKPTTKSISSGYQYVAPKKPDVKQYPHVNEVIKNMPIIMKYAEEYINNKSLHNDYSVVTNKNILVLEYLSKDYTTFKKDSGWKAKIQTVLFKFVSGNFVNGFASYVQKRDPKLYNEMEKYIGSNRVDVRDNVGRITDVAHTSFTTRVHLERNATPNFWSGWGGDLATGAADVHSIMEKYPHLDVQKVADAVIGGHPNVESEYLKKHGVKTGYHFNFTDMTDDADAIRIARSIRKKGNSKWDVTHEFSEHYETIDNHNRFYQFKHDGLDYSSKEALEESIYKKLNQQLLEEFGFSIFKDGATEEEQRAVSRAFANYIKSHRN